MWTQLLLLCSYIISEVCILSIFKLFLGVDFDLWRTPALLLNKEVLPVDIVADETGL